MNGLTSLITIGFFLREERRREGARQERARQEEDSRQVSVCPSRYGAGEV